MPEAYHSVQLVAPDDPGYVAAMRQAARQRPARGGPRQAGEQLGGMVEQAVRHWLAAQVPLTPERILSWRRARRERLFDRQYRELDAVWAIDNESLCLFEIKLTTPENMARGRGLAQLGRAAEILLASPRYRYVLERLVYVAAEPAPVLEGDIPALPPTDEFEQVGVVWAPPAGVEWAARELGLDLPPNWLDEEARQGAVADARAEAEEWRQYANTAAPSAAAPDSLVGSEGPLAAALRRAMQQSGE
jgi:hypothetical protein